MTIDVNSPGWRIRTATRGAGAPGREPAGLPTQFLTFDSRVAEEVMLDPAPVTRGQAAAGGPVDLSCDVEPGQVAILALRHPSGALTFHLPIQSTSRGVRGPSKARFLVPLRPNAVATRGLVSQAVKAILVKTAQLAGDKLVSLLLPKLVAAFEQHSWQKKGLHEGWLRVTKDTLRDKALASGTPVSPERSLLFIHGTFSNAASAYHSLTSSDFFERVKATYDDRLFAFDHFSLSRTPEENARMLLEGLPEQTTTFDVITHSRGGLVLRNLVERAGQFGPLARRFKVGRAVLVASPNEGTPLATPQRWDQTVGFVANLLELFPDNPFTTGAEFVANGIVWLANHASGDIPGLHAMDGQGGPIAQLQQPPGPPDDAYSALVANYNPTGDVLHRLLDVGLDQFFGSANDLVVPSEGGWRIDKAPSVFIPASRIGCYGPGGNLPEDSVTHVSFFSHAETADFLVTALEGRVQPLNGVDPRKRLPDRGLLRGAAPAALGAGPVVTTPARVRPARLPAPAAPLQVSIINGDLTFESAALLLGHYAASRLTGTESVMNRLVGGTMDHSLQLGLYPLAAGTHQIFINRHLDKARGTFIPRPKAVIVVGLGAEGKLESADLVMTVRLAVIGWARRLGESSARHDRVAPFELASTLIGSGGSGTSAGDAARLITQGVLKANALLDDAQSGSKIRWPRCTRLRLIELYLDRATEAWQALSLQLEATPSRFEIDEVVQPGTGGLPRPRESGYRGADYDFITVERREAKDGGHTIEYTLDTKRARSEIRGKGTQNALLDELVLTASNDQTRDGRIGRTLFNLLVPVDLEAYLAGKSEMQISLDPDTAAIPWELLDVDRGDDPDQQPWAIRVKLLRKLRLDTFRDQVVDARTEDRVLVIGEPECPPAYPRLEGARKEALAVRDALTGPDALAADKVTLLTGADPSTLGPNAEAVVNTLFEQPWRIVHIAGHGAPGEVGTPGGVVLSNGTFLGPDEIDSMRVVPELVFVNCCHIGRIGGHPPVALRYDRVRFASGVAGALIQIGVRCVIAAGWAVADDAASEFASVFYASLLRGNRFIDAVGEARAAAFERHGDVNTWAAYQCYGDPDWKFKPGAADPNRADGIPRDAGIASDVALALELKRICVETRFQGANAAAQVNRLQRLEQRYRARWGNDGGVAELFGQAYFEAGALESAMTWYARAVTASDGKATLKAAEQLGNVRSRLGWELVERALRHRDAMVRQARAVSGAKTRAATPSARIAARRALADAEKKLKAAIATARTLIARSLTELRQLAELTSTMERESMVASACKRRAMVDAAAGQSRRVVRDLIDMRKAYEGALAVGRKEKDADLFYPASNILAADVALGAGKRTTPKLDSQEAKIVRRHLGERSGANADFWSVAAGIELQQYQAIAARQLARRRRVLESSYQDLHARATSARMWASVYDNAYLVLVSYAQAQGGRERVAANAVLGLLRSFAHPEDSQ